MLKNILAAVGVGFLCHLIYDQGRKRALSGMTADQLDAAADMKRAAAGVSKPAKAEPAAS